MNGKIFIKITNGDSVNNFTYNYCIIDIMELFMMTNISHFSCGEYGSRFLRLSI